MGRSLIEEHGNSANLSGLDTSQANDEDFALELKPEDVNSFFQFKFKAAQRVVEGSTKKKAILTEKQIWYTLLLAKSVFCLGAKLSELIDFQKYLVKSCLVWQALYFSFFNLQ